ncbi:MFS transporter [Campylobacter jejuni]|nr:MFS transporter [Campylobacter jejuni]
MKHVNSIKLELVCKKISWRILPLIVLMFCLSMLDRTNISFVKSHRMFLIEGGITVLVGIFCLFYLDSHPKDAKWLDIKEKDILLKHIEISNTKAKDYSIKDIFKSILVWKFVFVYFCIQLSVYGVLFYLPSKIAQILQINVGFEVGLLNAIPWIFVFIALPIFTSLADKKHSWNLYAILFLLLASLSMIASTFVTNLVAFLFFISLAAIALIGSLGNLGGFVAPTLKTYIENHFGVEFGLIVLALIAILGVLVLIHLKITLNLDKGE